jgi:hypothetical protein
LELKKELRQENEKLIERFEKENKKLNKDLTSKIELETSNLHSNIEQVRADTDRVFRS